MSKKQPLNEEIFPLSVKFSARRALLNAEVQAKITDGTYKSKIIICRFPKDYLERISHLFSEIENKK
ncbi:hypothetical protein [Polynucleobacter sinensis]|uniref:hypothetical protein n=1 Tax=Polynucleobacter sinensis TaxID=1743157 RepID=UPI000786274B|nr:hypothetical protein [Polynucleobacter sinensis]